jgi:hypothetical protein
MKEMRKEREGKETKGKKRKKKKIQKTNKKYKNLPAARKSSYDQQTCIEKRRACHSMVRSEEAA